MTDDDWRMVSAPLNLSADARHTVEYAIELYLRDRNIEDQASAPAAAKTKLARVSLHAENLAALLDALGTEERAALDFAWYKDGTESDVDRELALVSAILQDIAKHTAEASWVAGADKRNNYASPVESLVGFLDNILREKAGTRVKGSNKGERQFVETVCAIADPEIGQGQIDEAIKATTHSNGEIAKFLRDKDTTTIHRNPPGNGATRRVSWKCIPGGDRS
jgi:hypothetical protein